METEGLLQKECNIFDVDGHLIEQYKTRVFTMPVGVVIPYSGGKQSVSAPALWRSFTYDEEGNRVASLPRMREWTQACEDAAQGSLPDEDPSWPGVPAGLKVANSTYYPNTVTNIPVGVDQVVATYTVLPTEHVYLRHIAVNGENRGKWKVLKNGSEVQKKSTWWTRFDNDFWFSTANGGILCEEGDVIQVIVNNIGEGPADFDASIGLVLG